jgi:hypothetical protein
MQISTSMSRCTYFGRVAAALLALCMAAAAAAAPLELGAAIDVAGRQRMLSQRIVKAYCQVGMQVSAQDSRAQLASAVRRFDQQLGALSKQVPNAAASGALRRLSSLWVPFRRIATGPVDKAGARRLVERDEALLRAANELVISLQDAAGTAQAKLVNMSGRQRMLSQRMAKLYMLRAWGLDTPALRDEIDSASNEFAGALATLRAAMENTPEIANELDAVSLQWEWFTAAIGLQGAESYTLVVAAASEAILNSMERITGLYAELTPR